MIPDTPDTQMLPFVFFFFFVFCRFQVGCFMDDSLSCCCRWLSQGVIAAGLISYRSVDPRHATLLHTTYMKPSN